MATVEDREEKTEKYKKRRPASNQLYDHHLLTYKGRRLISCQVVCGGGDEEAEIERCFIMSVLLLLPHAPERPFNVLQTLLIATQFNIKLCPHGSSESLLIDGNKSAVLPAFWYLLSQPSNLSLSNFAPSAAWPSATL